MFGSTILESALGLVFLYLLLSLLCSAAKEGLEALMKKRAIDLERGLRELLGDPKGEGIVKDFYEHPLIDGLFQGKYKEEKGGTFWSNLPSYIPAANFSQALLDVIQGPAPKLDAAVTPADAGVLALKRLRDSIYALTTNDRVKKALLALIDTADGDVNKARANIEAWFNSSMDRVAGWYKRWTQAIIFAMGLVFVVLLNADTLAIGNNLASDPSLRQTWTNAADEWVKKHPDDPDRGPLKENVNELRKLSLPIGWDREDSRRWPENAWSWVLKVLGLLMTTLAISLGAPFWFDVLSKFMVVRSTLKPKA